MVYISTLCSTSYYQSSVILFQLIQYQIWTAENSIPIPNFQVRLKHILSATSTQFFRYLWFMPSLGVRSPWLQPLHILDFFLILDTLKPLWSDLTDTQTSNGSLYSFSCLRIFSNLQLFYSLPYLFMRKQRQYIGLAKFLILIDLNCQKC